MSDEQKKPPLRQFSKSTECSDDFYGVFHESSSLVVECECGRVHFGGDGDYEEGEEEDLLAKMAKDPQRYLQHGDYSPWGELFGYTFVFDCPCGLVNCLEKQIWNNKEHIMRYLLKRLKIEAARKTEQAELAGKVSDLMKGKLLTTP